MSAKKYQFHESQAVMPPKMLWAIIILMFIVMGLFGYIYISQEFFDRPVGKNSIPTHWALIIFIATVLMTYYVSRLKIITRVDKQNLTMSLGVIGKRQFPLETIKEVRDYEGNPATDFLGYGYRIGIKQTGYVGRAEHAVILRIKDQKRELVITTDRAEALKEALRL